ELADALPHYWLRHTRAGRMAGAALGRLDPVAERLAPDAARRAARARAGSARAPRAAPRRTVPRRPAPRLPRARGPAPRPGVGRGGGDAPAREELERHGLEHRWSPAARERRRRRLRARVRVRCRERARTGGDRVAGGRRRAA